MDTVDSQKGVMEAWQQFLSQLEQELGPDSVKKWIPKVVRFDAGNIYLESSDSFQISWFEEHVRPRLKGLLNNNQRPIKVHLGAEKKWQMKRETPFHLSFSADSVDPEMTLENFIPSPENQIAYNLLRTLPNSPPFNPIYLYGPQGVGKTHLLMGVAISMQNRGKRVLFVRAETFTSHVVQAIRLGQMQAFRKIYRDIDTLIIDDIHIFARKTATQEEFFHTFNTLHTSGQAIFISANAPPTQLSEIEPRLISRFEWGITLAIQKADAKAILEKKATLWKFSLNEELMQFLLIRFPQNPLLALQALAIRSKGAPLTPLLAERLLKDLLEKEKENAMTPEKIIKAVAIHYGITSEDLLGSSHTRECVLPRQVAMYLCRDKLKMPFQKIGSLFQRDHSTVMSSVKQIQKAVVEKKVSIPL